METLSDHALATRPPASLVVERYEQKDGPPALQIRGQRRWMAEAFCVATFIASVWVRLR